MRIFVVSDSHGNIEDFLNKIFTMERPDLIIHLGDYVDDGLKIAESTGVETIIVKGNGDYFHKDYNEDELVDIKGKKIFMTHGHNYNVRYGVNRLFYKGKELNADLVLFGHTHVPVVIEEDNIIIMNPGSSSLPRTYDREKTFALLEIEKDIRIEIIKIK